MAYDPALEDIDEVGKDYARVCLVCNHGQRTPLKLASLAIRESRGAVVLLTEDYCIPSPRLGGCSRLERTQGVMRVAYKLLAPALPALLLGRMLRKAIVSSRHRWLFVGGCVPLTLLVLAWSWGGCLGYLTETRPRDLTVAAEHEED